MFYCDVGSGIGLLVYMYDEGRRGAASSETVSAGSWWMVDGWWMVARNPLQFVTICYKQERNRRRKNYIELAEHILWHGF